MIGHRCMMGAGPVLGVPTDGLICHYTMDSVVGSTLYDETGNYNGTINGAVQVDGHIGLALNFDGIDDGAIANIGTTSGPITYSFWFAADSTSVTRRIIAREWDEGGSFTTHHADGQIYAIFRRSDGAQGPDLCGGVISSGELHHLVAVFDGSSASLYLDGTLRDIVAQGSVRIDSNLMEMSPATWPFAGTIDEVRVFNRALTTAEIFALYHLG